MALGVLVDTSLWIEAMRRRGDPDAKGQVELLILDDQARLCELILLELWNGVSGDSERRWLEELERVVQRVEIDTSVWAKAKNLARAARSQGLTIPSTDLVIAACARVHELDLAHRDRHFESLATLS